MEESHSYHRTYKSGSAAFVSLSSANDFWISARAPHRILFEDAGAPRGRGTSRGGRSALRDYVSLAGLINGAVLGLVAQLVRARA